MPSAGQTLSPDRGKEELVRAILHTTYDVVVIDIKTPDRTSTGSYRWTQQARPGMRLLFSPAGRVA